ncbi:MAG TPA: hypothetical protein VGJ87_14630 [Roseiflexaceae bacterium]|jgi:hypothetical protein
MSTATAQFSTSAAESLERLLISLRTDLETATDQADHLDDEAAFDIGVELLDARRAVNAALDKLNALTLTPTGPFFAPTVVRSAALDAAYQLADELFA